MTKPDRFAQMVERASRGQFMLDSEKAIALLRRQFAQIRRRVVRQPVAKHAIALISRKDLLADLDAWRKE